MEKEFIIIKNRLIAYYALQTKLTSKYYFVSNDNIDHIIKLINYINQKNLYYYTFISSCFLYAYNNLYYVRTNNMLSAHFLHNQKYLKIYDNTINEYFKKYKKSLDLILIEQNQYFDNIHNVLENQKQYLKQKYNIQIPNYLSKSIIESLYSKYNNEKINEQDIRMLRQFLHFSYYSNLINSIIKKNSLKIVNI
jgi:hypothetical protein